MKVLGHRRGYSAAYLKRKQREARDQAFDEMIQIISQWLKKNLPPKGNLKRKGGGRVGRS